MDHHHRVPIRLGTLRTSVREAPPAAAVSNLRIHSISSESPTPLIRPAATGRVCRVCATNESRYSCPRCNVPYCSVDCYRSHGASCTEQFYQSHVTNEMAFNERATAAVDPKAQRERATQELLARVKQFQDETSDVFNDTATDIDGGDDIELSAERLAALALLDDTELSLDVLTPAEQARFLADIAQGKMSKYVMPWEPWWFMTPVTYEKETTARRRNLINEVGEPSATSSSAQRPDDEPRTSVDTIETSRFPAAIFTKAMDDSIPRSFDQLVRAPVSPTLSFHLVEILFAYAFTMRSFNGDWQQDPADATLSVLHHSDVLCADARFSSLEEVVVKCLEQRAVDSTQPAATNRLVLSDVVDLLMHRLFVLDALSDIGQMLEVAAGVLPNRKAIRHVKKAAKKLEFFLAWQCRCEDKTTLLAVADQLRGLVNEVTNVATST